MKSSRRNEITSADGQRPVKKRKTDEFHFTEKIDPLNYEEYSLERYLLRDLLKQYSTPATIIRAGKAIHLQSTGVNYEITLTRNIVLYDVDNETKYFSVASREVDESHALYAELDTSCDLVINNNELFKTTFPEIKIKVSSQLDMTNLSDSINQPLMELLIKFHQLGISNIYEKGTNCVVLEKQNGSEFFYLNFDQAFVIRQNSLGYYKFEIQNHFLGKGASSTVYSGLTYCATESGLVQKRENRVLKFGIFNGKQNQLYHIKNSFPEYKTKAPIRGFSQKQGMTVEIERKFEGSELSQVIKKIKNEESVAGIASIDEVLDWTLQLVRQLRSIHKNRIVHRDIKPDNIIIMNNGALKIIDFGFAEPVEYLEQGNAYIASNHIAGTFLYMAPEIMRGERASIKSDIYSLGKALLDLWGAKTLHEQFGHLNRKIIQYEAQKGLNIQDLFSWTDKDTLSEPLSRSDQEKLKKILSKMVAPDFNERINLWQVEQELHGIILARKFRKSTEMEQIEFNKVFQFACIKRNELSSIAAYRVIDLYTNVGLQGQLNKMNSSMSESWSKEKVDAYLYILGEESLNGLQTMEEVQDFFTTNIAMFLKNIETMKIWEHKIQKIVSYSQEKGLNRENSEQLTTLKTIFEEKKEKYFNASITLDHMVLINNKIGKISEKMTAGLQSIFQYIYSKGYNPDFFYYNRQSVLNDRLPSQMNIKFIDQVDEIKQKYGH